MHVLCFLEDGVLEGLDGVPDALRTLSQVLLRPWL